MAFPYLLRILRGLRSSVAKGAARPKRARVCRPFLELLENRLTPTFGIANFESLIHPDLVVQDHGGPSAAHNLVQPGGIEGHGAAVHQVFYVDFDGARGVTYNGPITVGNLDIPAFSAALIGLAGQETSIEAAVMAGLNAQFAGTDVTFTAQRPTDTDVFSTIYVGGSDSRFAAYGSFFGLAEQIDHGNHDSRDNALVFSDRIAATVPPSDAVAFTTALNAVIEHEAGHLLGGEHTDENGENGPLAAVAANGLKIVLDPGHGGSINLDGSSANNATGNDTGPKTGELEKDLTLKMAQAVQTQLIAMGFQVQLTRSTDINLTGEARARTARTFGADFFLSIHYNAGSPTIRGSETYIRWDSTQYAAGDNKNPGEDYEFAKYILNGVDGGIPGTNPRQGFPKEWVTADHMHSLANLYDGYLGNSDAGRPVISALVEVEYITNQDAYHYVTSAAGQNAIAQGIADGINQARLHFFPLSVPDTTPPTVTSVTVSPSSVIPNAPLTVTWNARDQGGSGLDHVGLFLYNGSSPVTSISSNGFFAQINRPSDKNQDNWSDSYKWTIPGLPSGSNYRVRVVARDNAGNPSPNSPAYESAPFTINNPPPLPVLQIGNVALDEGDSNTTPFTFNVTLSAPTSQTVTVQYQTRDTGSATAGLDYQPANGTLTFAPNQTSKTITVPVIGERTVELTEMFAVELFNLNSFATPGNLIGIGTILNDDHPRIGARVDGTQLTEGDSGTANATFHVSLSDPATSSVTVDWFTVDGTAVAGSDYVAGSGTLSFATGQQSKDVTVAVKGDTTAEASEVFYVRLRNPSSGLNIDNASATGTILDNDRPGIGIVNAPRVAEGDSGSRNADFTVRLSAATTQTVTVDYTTQDGTAQTNSDYSARSGTLTFNPNVTEQTVSIPVLGDTVVEPDETFSLILSNASNALVTTGSGSALATIINDDNSTQPQISVTGTAVDEGDTGTTTATVTVRLSAPSSQTVAVYYQTEDGTALDGLDYLAKGGPLTFNPNETLKTFTITILNDTVPEPEEYFRVRLSSPSGGVIAAGTAQVVIRDNDVPALILTDGSFAEGTGANSTATFTVTLSRASTQTVAVDYRTSTDGTATSGVDYLAASGTLTFNPGQTTKTIGVTLVGDSVHEKNETFFIDFTNAVNVTLGSKAYVQATIVDDDAPAQSELSINDVSVTEGNSGTVAATFTVLLAQASSQTVTVDFATADGTANAGSDYLAANNTLTFSPGQTSKTITITVNGDTVPEANEDFFVNLLNPNNATLVDATGRGTILNDEPSSPPALSISDASLAEGDSGSTFATFTVTLSTASTQQVIVNFASQDGTATDGSDYVGVLGGLTFSAGQTSKTITVQVNGDTTVESDETFFIRLSSPVNAVITQGNGRGTIVNDDFRDLPTLTVEGSTVAEGNTGTKNLFFTVRLSRQSDLPVTVDFATANGTATAGSDYVATSGALTFIPGEMFKVVNVVIQGDTTNEADETLMLSLLNPGNATILTASATGIIANDDGGSGIIKGRLFGDLNANGNADTGESGLPGFNVYLDLNRNGQFDSGEPMQVTDADGNYEFTGLAAGTYYVRELSPSGWSQTFPCLPPGLHQVTNNNIFFDINPQTNGCQVTWEEQYSNGTEDVWLQDAFGQQTKLTDFPFPTSSTGAPQINSGEVVFGLLSGTNNQIFLRTGENTVQLTSNSSSNEKPQIDRGQVTWMAYGSSTHVYDVFLYDGLKTTQISPDDGIDDYNPRIKAGRLGWQHGLNDASEIMYFNGVSTVQLTNNAFADQVPQIDDAGNVTWQGWDGHDWEIFFYDGTAVTQLTNNDYDDVIPRISAGQVTWKGSVGGADSEIFYYDGVTVQQLTDNTTSDSGQQIDNGRVVWEGYDPVTNGTDIFYHDAFGTVDISNRVGLDSSPQISGNKVVWFGNDGSDYEIYEYVLTDAQAVLLTTGHTVAGVDFGVYHLQTVSGQKFNDLNGDGVQNDGEPGLAGWTVQLDIGNDGTIDRTTTTDADGVYSFAGLRPGPSKIIVVPQASWTSTTADSAFFADNSEGGGGADGGGDVDFGTFLPVSISGHLFNDINGNGSRDADEPALVGWVVQLDLNNDGSVDATATTDGGGDYSFLNVGPGSHRISEVAPSGWTQTSPGIGSYVLTTVSGQGITGLNFGSNSHSLSITDVNVIEGDRGTVNATFTVTLSAANAQTVTVDFATANGTAMAGSDYQAVSGTLTFAPGQTSKTISVAVIGDTVDEANEMFIVNLSNASNATIADSQGLGTIIDDDPTPGPTMNGQLAFSAATYTVREKAGIVTLAVNRTAGFDGTVAVQYDVSVATSLRTKYQAVPGTDFTGALHGTLTFNSGEAQKTVTFAITAENLVEENKSFVVTLSSPAGGATLGSQVATTATILDDNLPVVPNSAPKLTTLQNAGIGFGTSDEHYQQFVRSAYDHYLRRKPSDGEVAYWVGLMKAYQNDHTKGLKQEQIEAGFIDSVEYIGRFGSVGKAWVDGIYLDLLSRVPDSKGESYWVGQLAAGVAPSLVALGFTSSLERLQNRVSATYLTLLERPADANGLNYWVNVFSSGGTTEDINSGFVGSIEYYNKANGAAGNPAKWIREAYLDVLFRSAYVSEMTYWLGFLNG